MVTLKIKRLDRFPAGTSVSLYGDEEEIRARLGQAPQGPVVKTATVAADGTLTFTTLPFSTTYYAYALVGGENRWVASRTLDPNELDAPPTNVLYLDDVHDTNDSDAFQIIRRSDGRELGWMTKNGAFGIGPNPSFRQQGNNKHMPATDFIVDWNVLEGGTGRNSGRSWSGFMVNDPADLNLHRAEGSPTGNFTNSLNTYSTGTVAVTNGSDIVTGTGTAWTTVVKALANAGADRKITIAGDTQTRTIAQVLSATSIQLRSGYGGTTGSGKTYNIDGTVNVTNGRFTVTGNGTAWTSDLENESFQIGSGPVYRVDSVVSETELTLATPYLEADASEQSYTIGFNGFPYGKNGDGSQMYPVKAGALIGTLEALGYMPAGSFQGGHARAGMSCTEDPFQHVLDGHLALPWAHGDTTITLDVDPAAFHIRQLDTQGNDQGNYPIRAQGQVTVIRNNGKGVTVSYQGYSSADKRLLGCSDTGAVGDTADAGKLVTQTRLHAGGQWVFNAVAKGGYRMGDSGLGLFGDDGFGVGTGGVTNRASWAHIKGGQLRVSQLADPSGGAYTIYGTGGGTTRWNYYFVFRNTQPGEAFGDTVVTKIHVPDGKATWNINNFIGLTVSSLVLGWWSFDVVKVAANADTSDASSTYTSIAEGVDVHLNNSTKGASAVDYGQTVNPAYVMPVSSRNQSGDVRVEGFLRGDAGRSAGVRRITDVLTGIYSTGTVDVTNGSPNVVGHGTAWTADMAGKSFRQAGSGTLFTVQTVTDATHIVLASNYTGSTVSAATYNIGVNGDGRVPGQQFTLDGRETYVEVTTTAYPLDFYLAKASTISGREHGIADAGGNAAVNNFTIHPAAGDAINGGSTYTINQNRGGALLWSNGNSSWRAHGVVTSPAASTAIDAGIVDAAGDQIVATANDTVARHAVGANNTVWTVDTGQTDKTAWKLLLNAHIDPAAAIARSKLDFGSGLVNADIATGAAIAYAKLALTGSILNADISASAAIAYSKLALTGSIVNGDISASAAIAYSKLNLTTSIVNADISTSAAIAYSKLNLATSIVNGDISASAAIAYTKLALTNSIVNGDISSSAAIAYSKLALTNSIVVGDLAAALSSRIPTQSQADALAGTSGSPSSTNKYVTDADVRLVGLTVTTQTGAYTFVLADAGTMVILSAASDFSFTVPTNASVAYAVGTQIALASTGAGLLTVAAAGGVTVGSAGNLVTLAGANSTAVLTKIATNTWILSGDLV